LIRAGREAGCSRLKGGGNTPKRRRKKTQNGRTNGNGWDTKRRNARVGLDAVVGKKKRLDDKARGGGGGVKRTQRKGGFKGDPKFAIEGLY